MASVIFFRGITIEGGVEEPSPRGSVEREDPSIITAEEASRLNRTIRFGQLLDSYNQLAQRQESSSPMRSMIEQEMGRIYETLEYIAKGYPELKNSLPPDPFPFIPR